MCMALLLTLDENKSHYGYVKNFNKFMWNKIKHKNKKHLSKCCLRSFSSEKVLIEHKENCFIINGKQGTKLRAGSIEFKNHFKQLTVPFKIFADFESLLKKGLKVIMTIIVHTMKNIKIIFLTNLLIKLFVLVINLANIFL